MAIAPTLNLNGSSKRDLLADYIKTLEALRAAREAMTLMAPHGRDYQTMPAGTWEIAVREHRARMEKLMSIETEITAIAEAVQSQNTGRK